MPDVGSTLAFFSTCTVTTAGDTLATASAYEVAAGPAAGAATTAACAWTGSGLDHQAAPPPSMASTPSAVASRAKSNFGTTNGNG